MKKYVADKSIEAIDKLASLYEWITVGTSPDAKQRQAKLRRIDRLHNIKLDQVKR